MSMTLQKIQQIQHQQKIYNGLTPESFWGGDIHITSAAPNAYAHVFSSQKGLDVSSEDNVNKILDNLAHKIYYHNYVMVKETFKVQ